MEVKNSELCTLCCSTGELVKAGSMQICARCMEEIAYVDKEERTWSYAAGEEGDKCSECGEDLSDVADILLYDAGNRWVLACVECIAAIELEGM